MRFIRIYSVLISLLILSCGAPALKKYTPIPYPASGNGNPASLSKCNEWKNGFHTTEHALVMYILGKNLEGKPVDLYFAVSPAQADTFIAKPYLFEGAEVSRTNLGNFTVDGTTLAKVKVTFKDIY